MHKQHMDRWLKVCLVSTGRGWTMGIMIISTQSVSWLIAPEWCLVKGPLHHLTWSTRPAPYIGPCHTSSNTDAAITLQTDPCGTNIRLFTLEELRSPFRSEESPMTSPRIYFSIAGLLTDGNIRQLAICHMFNGCFCVFRFSPCQKENFSDSAWQAEMGGWWQT